MEELRRVLVLAGDRGGVDPLLAAAGVTAKALAPVAGEPSLLRVLRTLNETTGGVAKQLIGPHRQALLDEHPELAREIEAGPWPWQRPAESPVTSMLAALAAEATRGVLVTTADHALLSGDTVRAFVTGAVHSGANVAVGFVRHEKVMAAAPGTRRTALKFRDGRFCTCNLFWLGDPSALQVLRFWKRVEALRKQPWRIARVIGPTAVVRYLSGTLALQDALRILGKRVGGVRIAPVFLDDPLAAIDVDSVADWRLANDIAARGSSAA